jgi:fatty acid desaturase
MINALMLSQIVFYFTVSIAIIAVGILFGIFTYHLIKIAKELQELSHNLNHGSAEAMKKINDIIDRLSDIPILSYFLKKRETTHEGSKGRKEHHTKK